MKTRIRLRRSSTKVYRRLQDGPVLPPWVRVLPFVLGFLIFGFVSLEIFREDDLVVDQQVQDEFNVILENDVAKISDPEIQARLDAATSGVSVPTAPPDEPGSFEAEQVSGSVTLPVESGGVSEVPAAALAVARASVMALFTGNFNEVPIATGVAIPDVARTWEDPSVGDPMIVAFGESTIRLSFQVDPDRDGPESVYKTSVVVLFTPDLGWVWAGA